MGFPPAQLLTKLDGADSILPVQYFNRAQYHSTGERALMAAVLEDAIKVYQKYALYRHGYGRMLFDEVQHWIASDDMSWLFSYKRICEAIGIDGDALRQKLNQWHKDKLGIADEAFLQKLFADITGITSK